MWMACCPRKRGQWVCVACALLSLCWFHARTFAKPPQVSAKPRLCWQVSNYGRCKKMSGTISHGCRAASGYRVVMIERKVYMVHRLVKFAFHGPPRNDQAWQVNHLDGNKSNNHLDNLHYATPSENSKHSFASGSRQCGGLKLSMPVMWRAFGVSRWTTSPAITAAAKCLGFSRHTVSKCCHKQRSAKGIEFQFARETSSLGCADPEAWRTIRDPRSGNVCGGRQVSSLGRLRLRGGRISKGSETAEGYFVTCLPCLQQRRVFVHRLVAAAFLGDPPSPEHTHINHKDGDKRNNNVDNLEYVTPAENKAHYHANAICQRGGSDVKAVESRVSGGGRGRWIWHRSIKKAAETLGVDSSNICKSITGCLRQTGGYEFRLSATNAAEDLPGEEWRDVNLTLHLRDRAARRWTPKWCWAVLGFKMAESMVLITWSDVVSCSSCLAHLPQGSGRHALALCIFCSKTGGRDVYFVLCLAQTTKFPNYAAWPSWSPRFFLFCHTKRPSPWTQRLQWAWVQTPGFLRAFWVDPQPWSYTT